MDNNFDSKKKYAGWYSSGLPADDRQRAVPFDVQNYTPIKGIVYFTVFTALSFSILAFALVSQLRVDDQSLNSVSGIAQPVSQAITKQSTPATDLMQTIETETEAQDGGDPVNLLEHAVETEIELNQPLELFSPAMELAAAELAESTGPVKEIEGIGEQVSVQEPLDGSANIPAPLPEPSVPALELATTESIDETVPQIDFQLSFESKNHAEEVIEVTERPAQQSEPMTPLATELAAIADFDAENQSLPESISDIDSIVHVEEKPVQQAERIQPELAVVADSEIDAQQAREPASNHKSLQHIDADSGQGSKSLQSTQTELVQVTAVGVTQQNQIEPISDTESLTHIDEKPIEQPRPAVPVLEPLATELSALTDFDAENQSLPESISDIEWTVYVEETQVQKAELAALEPELEQDAEPFTDDQSLGKLTVPAELVMQAVAEHEQPDQISGELQPVTTQLVQVAALGITQQTHIEPIRNTESVTQIGEESVDQSQPAVPVLKTIVTELTALTDFYEENQSLPESISDIELAAYVGELLGPAPALLETEAKQVAESLIDDQRYDEKFLPAESVVKVEAESAQNSSELQPATIQLVQETELAEAPQSETNDEGLGGPITDYEQALQVDQQPNQQTQPDVTVLEPVSGEEKLVPTGVVEPVILLSSDLESLANAPVVLTESSVRPGDTLSALFERNNLSYKFAQRLISAPGSKPISVLYPRDHLKFVWSNNKLLGIELRRKNRLSLMATYDGSQFTVINIREARQAGTIVKLLKQEIESVEREDLIDYETQYAKLKSTNLNWSTTTVRNGDALSKIFRRAGLSAVEAIAVAGYPGNEWLATGLKPGQVMNIAKSEEGKFSILEVPEKGTAKVRLVFPVEGGYFVGFKKIKAEVQEHYACAEVQSSLYSAGNAINIPREVLDEFVSLFESRFDFSRQLQRGDQFCIIYDREYIKGKPLKEININAGSLIQEGAELRAFRHVDDDGRVTYYDSEGLNMQGHFLRSPIKSARVVSKYSKRRYHPVLKTNRPHLGVDYGARTGTPIRSTATGQIIKRGWSGGYGRMIVVQHGSKYRTLYAHMSRYADGSSVGSYVKQGQVIGYVGSSGLSTGPHLHYEFHVNGRHRDPLQYDMPKGQPIPEQYKVAFQAVVDDFSKRLASIDAPQVEYRPSSHQTASSQ